MKFLIQKIKGKVVHDFAFTLIRAAEYHNWLHPNEIKIKFVDFGEEMPIPEPNDIYPNPFKSFHSSYVPVGTVEFVTDHLLYFHNLVPKPINVPEELFDLKYTNRQIFNGNDTNIDNLSHGKWFVKSNDKIKGLCNTFKIGDNHIWGLPEGNYQYSKYITIDSEWRAFVYDGKLVGLQNYCGEFTLFPNVNAIIDMIKAYKSASIAYTLDIGVSQGKTFVIEVHPMISVGLYGFNNFNILPFMFYRSYRELIKNR